MTQPRGVDPAKTRGVRNRNPGNIERVKGTIWQGAAEKQTDKRFVVFKAPEWGIRAIARVLITYQDGKKARDGSKIDTVKEIIDRWAPPSENNTNAYVEAVADAVRSTPNDPLDVTDWATMRGLVCAIIAHECAGYRYPDAVIDNGLVKAGLKPPAKVVSGGIGEKIAKVGAAAGAAVLAASSAAPEIVASLPAAKQAYDKAAEGMGPLAEALPWLPAVAGLLVAVGVLVLAIRNSSLKQRLA